MQTLGLASEAKPSDGMLKRLFWPTIENRYDVDLIGQQGFWICVIAAVLSLVPILFAMGSESPLTVVVNGVGGLLVATTYLLGGMGVRERSVTAAALVFFCYLLDRVSAFELGGHVLGFPPVGLVALMLLFANVRATVLSRRWEDDGVMETNEEAPYRSAVTLPDKFANVMPSKVWPWGRFVFYPIVALVLLFSVIGIVAVPMAQKRAAAQRQRASQQVIEGTPEQQ